MWQDPIVEEVREVRQTHAAKYNFDLKTIYLELKNAEEKNKYRKVSFPPKRIKPIKAKMKPALSA